MAEAEKVHHIETLLAVVEGEYGKNQEFNSVYMAYRQLANRNEDKKRGSVDTHAQAPVMLQRQRLPAVVVGLLLVGIVGGGLYWGIPGLRNLGMAISTAATTVPDTAGTEAPLAGAPNMVSAEPSSSNNTAIVTQTQVSAMSFTATPEPPPTTPVATVTHTPTTLPTSQPTATAMPTPGPCMATVKSTTGATAVSLRESATGKTIGYMIPINETVLILTPSADSTAYQISYNDNGREIVGWLPADNVRLSKSCPR